MRDRCEQRSRLVVCCAALMLVLVATVANAQVHPNVERGIAVDKLYQFGDIDQINVFNGNLSLRIPIGASSTVSEHLSYALTLVYNSKIWDSERFVIPDGLNDVTFHRFPSRLCNAGLGWKLSLGTLLDPSDTVLNPGSAMRYEAPDGSSHGFYASLHPTDAANGDFYTLDGSYLRLSSLGSNAPGISRWNSSRIRTVLRRCQQRQYQALARPDASRPLRQSCRR